MENPNILDMDYKIFRQIKLILDNDRTRDDFLTVVPPEYFNCEAMELMEVEGNGYNMTPGKWLLYYLGSKDVRVSHLVSWFETADLQRALILLKREEPLQIISQPLPNLLIQEGSKLVITCIASSYPPPDYQWFKWEEELPLQQESELIISSVRNEDNGIYVCRVSKKNIQLNNYSCLFSDPVEVIVSPDLCTKSSDFERIFRKSELTNSLPHEQIPKIGNKCEQQKLVKTSSPKSEKIVIKHHPYAHGKIAQGSKFCLTCIAISTYPLNYQWHKNGKILDGEVSYQLLLNDLYPDPHTGDLKFEYLCEIYNEYDRTLSQTAIVELAESNDTTPFVAKEKIAFMIANDIYEAYEENLATPAIDVADIAKLLESIDFKVLAFRNLNLIEMRNTFHAFCSMLKVNSYALFYFAGHGFELYGQTYLQPVDCSESCLPTESICTEYILQCMQDTEPALNILLIDACRKLPPDPWVGTAEIFEAHMKNNTVCGYSTSFLSGAYESTERNSFFVKHLKKYIVQNKSIQNILFQVQKDCAGERLITNLQNPVIKSSLCVPRKLCDPLQNPADMYSYSFLRGASKTRDPIEMKLRFPNLKCTFIIEIKDHMGIYFNGIDVYTYLSLEEDANLNILFDIEINTFLYFPELRVDQTEGIQLKNAALKVSSKNLLFKKEVLGIQHLKNQQISGKILLNFLTFQIIQEQEFSIKVEKIEDMKIFY